MILLLLYLPLKYLFLTFHNLHNLNEIIIVNSIYDVTILTLFILWDLKFSSIFKVFLFILEIIFWIYFIYKETSSLIYTLLLIGFILFYRFSFIYFGTPKIVLFLVFKEVIFFITIITCNVRFNFNKIDFLSYIFSLISYYLDFGEFKVYLISLVLNTFIMIIYYILSLLTIQKKKL